MSIDVIIFIVLCVCLLVMFFILCFLSYFSDLNEIRNKYLEEKALEHDYFMYELYRDKIKDHKYDKFRKK